uniref:Uncharacterized protein n=1 Tax=Avena sativa TaxID=4498 RepID=A0ACD5VAJ5_AVESA
MEEFTEEVQIVEDEDNEPPEVRKNILANPSPPTRAVSVRGEGRDEEWKTKGTICASMGAMVPLVGKLDMLLGPQGWSSKRVKDAIHLLKADVEEISCYLHELAEVEDPPPTGMCWMNEARDLSYDMEDFIHSLYEKREDPSIVAKTYRALGKFTSPVKTPKRLVQTISEFRMYVQEAIQRREVYGLSDSGPCSVSNWRRRFVSVGPMLPTRYEETADIIVDGRMNEFITSLAEDGEQHLKVISVFGSSCLGKTTFARVLYNRFVKQYSCQAFIRVSRKPDMKRIFGDMLSQLQGKHPPHGCKEIELIDSITKYLQDKSYLIIIDDVWTASLWNAINQVFPKGSHGSRIITTTQIEDVALTCCRYRSELVFEMKPLDEDHSRKLFFNRLFFSESYCPQDLKEILTEIVEICGGLPLATVSIASLLASQPVITIDLLTYIYQSLISCFSANSTSERTRKVLNLSYNNLPNHLKTCLLYVSMYLEGRTFYKDDLVKQWMAEGFIETTQCQVVEKVAESYLHQLIGRRFIQPTSINYNNEVVSCTVHDAVHDLIAHKSAEENFIVAIDYSQMNVALSHKVRRLSLLFGDTRYAKTPANIGMTQVRSLTFFGLHECMPCITEFKLLCVLNLQLCDHGGDNNLVDLSGISELFQLRYLKIASDVCIKLPNHGLECLETLDITDARVSCVPWNIHLPRMLHLSLSDEVDLMKWIDSLVSYGKLNYLQELHITSSSTSDFHYLRCIIESSHEKLKTIIVRPGSLVKNVVVPDKVAQIWNDVTLPPLLQRFEFVTHNPIVFSRIPPSVEKHGNLCSLNIEVRDLDMRCVDILKGLPVLTALSLYVHSAPFQRIMFDKAGFSVLKYLKLRFTSGIAWLKFEAGAMPNLCKLKLVFYAIPRMDQQLALISDRRRLFEHHKDGTAVISIDHMPCVKEISVKFGGAAADVQYALRVGVSNHPSNPTINKQPMDCRFYGDKRSKLKQQLDEILVEEQEEYDQKQPDEYHKQQKDKILEEEQDEYRKHQPDKILEEEPDEYNKHQPDKILEDEPDEYHKTSERSADTSILSSPKLQTLSPKKTNRASRKSFPPLHVSDTRFMVGSVKEIVRLAIDIKKALGTVHQCKNACDNLREVVNTVQTMVAPLGTIETPRFRAILTSLEADLRRAYDLVKACQKKRSIAYTLFTSRGLSKQLLKVREDIQDHMVSESFATSIIILMNPSPPDYRGEPRDTS